MPDRRVQYDKVIWARVQIYFGIVQSTVLLPFYYISNCLKKMSLLNYILMLLSYHVNNKTLQTFDFLNYMHLTLKRTSSYKNTHTQLTNIPNNKIFETKRAYGSQLRTIADECTLYVIVLRHTFSGIWF